MYLKVSPEGEGFIPSHRETVSRRGWGPTTTQRFAFRMKLRLASDEPFDTPVFSGLPGVRFQVEEAPQSMDAVDIEIFNSANWFRVRTSSGSLEFDPEPDLPVNTWFDLVIGFDLDSKRQRIQYSLFVGGPLYTLRDQLGNEWFPFEENVAQVGGITINGRGSGTTGSQISVSVDDVIVDLDVPTEPCESSVFPGADQTSVAVEGQAANPAQIAYTIENFGTISHDYTVEELAMSAPPSIADLYQTGVDNSRVVLGAQVLDPHWTIIEGGLAGTCTEGAPCSTYTVIQDGFPIPSPWLANDATSMWITADPLDDDAVAPAGTHVFRTNFTLADQAAVDAAFIAGRIMTDTQLAGVQINGVPTDPPIVVTGAGFTRRHSFTVRSGFQVGSNTLDFEVSNGVGAPNPLALRVEFFDLPASDVPWLSTDFTPPLTVASGSTDTVTATIGTAGLAPGLYTGFLKFTSDCADPAPEEFIRGILLTVTNWEVTPAEDASRAVVGLSGDCGSLTPAPVQYTVTNTGTTTLDYIVEKVGDCDWLTLDKGGAQVTSGNSDTVTGTIDASGLPVGDHTCRLVFTNVGTGLPTELRIVTLSVLGTVWQYDGAVDPESADSAGTGLSFFVDEGVKQGAVEADAEAINGWVWRLQDTDAAKTKFRSQPDAGLTGEVGVTVVARVKVRDQAGGTAGGLFIWDTDDGLTSEYHWGGASTGLIREETRNFETGRPADGQFHTLRMTAEGTSSFDRTIKLYFDEDSTPVISIANASPESPGGSISGKGFGFGAGNTSGTMDIAFDCVAATNAGAFAPGEEVGCLGLRLCNPCPTPFADADGDSDVDQADFALFQRCFSGTDGGILEGCSCFNRDFDDDVDEQDFGHFEACATGPAVPFDPQSPPPGCIP